MYEISSYLASWISPSAALEKKVDEELKNTMQPVISELSGVLEKKKLGNRPKETIWDLQEKVNEAVQSLRQFCVGKDSHKGKSLKMTITPEGLPYIENFEKQGVFAELKISPYAFSKSETNPLEEDPFSNSPYFIIQPLGEMNELQKRTIDSFEQTLRIAVNNSKSSPVRKPYVKNKFCDFIVSEQTVAELLADEKNSVISEKEEGDFIKINPPGEKEPN